MDIIEKAKKWALEFLKDEDTLAILLVGSWAKGHGSDIHDIDLIVIKEFQLVAIYHREEKREGYSLDIWVHDIDGIKADLFKEPEDLNQVNNTSMILSFFGNMEIWFEREPFLEELIDKVKNWDWPDKVDKFLNFTTNPPITDYLQIAYTENVKLLDKAKIRCKEGLPISHRRKDYAELITEKSEEHAKKTLELTEIAYQALAIERNWSEFDDARKAIKMGQWGNGIASLKDTLRFIIRYELNSVPEQLLDPAIWKAVEEMSMRDEVIQALKEAYK